MAIEVLEIRLYDRSLSEELSFIPNLYCDYSYRVDVNCYSTVVNFVIIEIWYIYEKMQLKFYLYIK